VAGGTRVGVTRLSGPSAVDVRAASAVDVRAAYSLDGRCSRMNMVHVAIDGMVSAHMISLADGRLEEAD
jgi:hypothetical protein